MELFILLALASVGGWAIIRIVWSARAHHFAAKKRVLDDAWREVLDDPDYLNGRTYEEHKRGWA
jgi:hypothetical protein